MTRGSIEEYAEALRARYHSATKEGKGRMLDEFTGVTGLHRKAAIRLLNGAGRQSRGGRRGRKREYGVKAAAVLKVIWEACDRLCSKRLKPFMGEMAAVLRKHGEQQIDDRMGEQLCRMSASTIDRLLRPYRRHSGRKPPATTRPGSLLKNAIPIRTFADWKENRPGFVETDLVAHCGDSSSGFYLSTLCAVDVASGWTECLPLWGKYQQRVRQAIHYMRQRLPVPLLGIDSDNGGEFINRCLYNYCQHEKITFTRSRAYRKNDSCHVEQKNGNVVRRFVGYDRYASRHSFQCLGRVYELVRLYINFFQPTMKLVSRVRHGAKVRKVYDTARTPYQRLLHSGALTDTSKAKLASVYASLNPVKLLKQINDNLQQLWRTADHQPSVTVIMTHPPRSR